MQETFESLTPIKEFFQAIPGPVWGGVVVFLWALTEYVKRRTAVYHGNDNKTALYYNILALLKDPSRWSRDGLALTAGKVKITLPTRTKTNTLDDRIWFTNYVASVSVTVLNGRDEDAGLTPRRLRKVTRLAKRLYHAILEREAQAKAGQCLCSVREQMPAAAPDPSLNGNVPLASPSRFA